MPLRTHPIRVRVPATTANLGAGFDTLGIALNLYNTIELGESSESWPDPFLADAAALFYQTTGLTSQAHQIQISGDVPRSRGLGSSVTVRLGLLAALDARHEVGMSRNDLFRLVNDLEGHPDNVAPACFGGFVASAPGHYQRFPVKESLAFITWIPSFHSETEASRRALPTMVSRIDCVHALQHTALITAAFASQDYSQLRGLFDDRLHEPHRLPGIPGAERVRQAALSAGALGVFLSGAGPSLIALAQDHQAAIADAMREASKTCTASADSPYEVALLQACNDGYSMA